MIYAHIDNVMKFLKVLSVRRPMSNQYSMDIWPQTDDSRRGGGRGGFRWSLVSHFRGRLKVLCWDTNHLCNLIILRRIPVFVNLVWAPLCYWNCHHGYFRSCVWGQLNCNFTWLMSWCTNVMMLWRVIQMQTQITKLMTGRARLMAGIMGLMATPVFPQQVYDGSKRTPV